MPALVQFLIPLLASNFKYASLVSSTNNTCDNYCKFDSQFVHTQPLCKDDHEVGSEVEVQT